MAIPPKVGVNSLTNLQLDDLINYCQNNYIYRGRRFGLRILQRVGNGTEIYAHGQVIYFTNYSSSPYPRLYVPDEIWNSWPIKPLTRSFLFHLVFWRWINGGRLCDLNPNMHISHLICYRGPINHDGTDLTSENFLLLREEDKKINESRKYCWDQHVDLDFLGKGICPHRPKCQLIDWDPRQ